MNTNIHINVGEIPPEVAERIGRVFLEYHKRFQQIRSSWPSWRHTEPHAIRTIKAARAAGK